ncbi:hypothetical protein EXIGLDRAFT_780539 [Exidia glandulosa HHB12029]|uniref:F-box domain-containing protein n=1 Tax=Exidia glandulosa HHB12029 TaxID=1314781 RepID=A0A165BKB6_EXIGL|nr:hypothetical protein EXIGLDRAFT_780539 [Exidia glandulosa HHB12029]
MLALIKRWNHPTQFDHFTFMPGITDLPEDLLVPIFSLARESPLDVLQLGYVCSDWKRIVSSTGALFAEITAGTDYDTDVSFDQLSGVLVLSRDAPLHLTVRCWVEKDYNVACAAILDHMGHIRELELHVDVLDWESHGTAVCPLKSALSVPAPMLEDAFIDLDGAHLWAVVDYQLFGGFAPCLTRLQLHGVEITNPIQPAFSRIEYFFGPSAISDMAGRTALVAHALTLGQLFPALADLTLTDSTSFLAITECDVFPTHLDGSDIRYCRRLRDDESDEIETGYEALRGLETAN